MPFGPYDSMADCIAKNQQASDPGAYCAQIHYDITGKWPSEAMHPDFQKIYKQFQTVEDGETRYWAWIKALNLDETRPYGQSMKEQFKWVKRHVDLVLWKEDTRAKYWQVEAGFPVESMNRNIYSSEELHESARTLAHKPVNLNHKFPLPTIEIPAAKYEDGVVEAILRIPKNLHCPICDKTETINNLIENGGIVNVSLEAQCTLQSDEPQKCEGMEFTGLSLLSSATLPGIPLTRLMPLEHIMVEALQSSTRRRKNVKTIKMEVFEDDKPEPCPEGQKRNPETGKCEPITPEEQARNDAARAKAHFHISDEKWNSLSEEEKQAYIDKLPTRGSAEMQTVDITPIQPKPSMEPDENGQCQPGYMLNTIGKCVPTEDCGDGRHWDANANDGAGACVADTPPKPEHPETSHGLPAAPQEDVLTDAPLEQPTAGEQPPITGTDKITSMPPSGEPAPQAPASLPADVQPQKPTVPDSHDCGDGRHYDYDLDQCVPNQPITETALKISQAKVDADNAKIQLKTMEDQRDDWKNRYQQTLAQNLTHETKIKTLEQRIEKLERLRNEAQRNFLNEQTEKEKAVAKHRTEIANREEYREQAEQWKATEEQTSRKYHSVLSTNLELSKRLTKANEDYLNVATERDRLKEALNKAKSISKKVVKIRV